MTYVEQAIQKAIEGGYNSYDLTNFLITPIDYQSLSWLFLSPLFWQSLGKSLGLKYIGPYMRNAWETEWHSFIDHLAEGKDAESFFESLINVKG